MIKRWKQGFTLVELLIVMAIVAVLVGVSANGIIVQGKKSRDARRMADLETIRGALERYRLEEPTPGMYPPTVTAIPGPPTPTGWAFRVESYSLMLSPYLEKMPTDPKSGYRYMIEIYPTGKSYKMGTRLEYPNPPPAWCLARTCNTTGSGGSDCTYCVTNP